MVGHRIRGRRAIRARSCRQTLASAQVLLTTDPSNALVLAYDAARQACTALLAQQGLRQTTTGGHVAVDRILPHLDLFG